MASAPRGDQGPGTGDRETAPIPNPQSPIPAAIDVDAAIDLVAREMTDADAPAWLRAKVLEQLEPGPAAPGLAQPRWAWMSAAAVVLIAAVGSWWLVGPRPAAGPTPSVSNPVPASARTGQDAGSLESGTTAGMQPRTDTAAAVVASAAPASSRPRRPRPAPEPAAESAAAIEWRKLAPEEVTIDPISVGPLPPAFVEIEELGFEPIAQPEPLTIPSLAPGSPDPQTSEPSRR